VINYFTPGEDTPFIPLDRVWCHLIPVEKRKFLVKSSLAKSLVSCGQNANALQTVSAFITKDVKASSLTGNPCLQPWSNYTGSCCLSSIEWQYNCYTVGRSLNPEVKRPLERPRRRWEDGIKWTLRRLVGWCWVDSPGSWQGPLAGCCECGYEPLCSGAMEVVSYSASKYMFWEHCGKDNIWSHRTDITKK
jgi:hypothetical protein